MKPGHYPEPLHNESAVANMIEYLMISGVIMGLLVIMLLLVNTNIMEDPANRLVYVAFTDIGNGVSTRMVDVYAIAPQSGNISSKFDIPDEIVGRNYVVDVEGRNNPDNPSINDQFIRISRGAVSIDIELAGIAASRTAKGSTTGAGVNVISYDSRGFE